MHQTLKTQLRKHVAALATLLAVLAPASTHADLYPPTPEAVVIALCDSYSKGLGLDTASSAQITKYTTWMDTPGWDRVDVVTSYAVTAVESNKDSAKVTVRFHLVGYLESGESHFEFHSLNREEDVNLRLIKVAEKWKVSKPVLHPHISVRAAISILESELSAVPRAEGLKLKKEISSLKNIDVNQQ